MKTSRTITLFRKILVPAVFGYDDETALALAAASAIAGKRHIVLVGVVPIPDGDSLSTAALPARDVRQTIQKLAAEAGVRAWQPVYVSHRPWDELVKVVESASPDLLVLAWPRPFDALHTNPSEALAHPPCNIAVASGPIPGRPRRVLAPIRGGPFAELALRLSLSIAHTHRARVTSLHVLHPSSAASQDAPFRGIARVLDSLPEVRRKEMHTDDPASAILSASRKFDLVVMGATARPAHEQAAIGPVAARLLSDSTAGVIVVKTRRPMPANLESEEAGQTAISVLVDKWFAENTYHANEFEDLHRLIALKRRQNLTISLALPALDEEETVGEVIHTVKSALAEGAPLLDEIVLVDSNSTDRTREIAASLGVPVHIHQATLPPYGARHGKGEAL